MAMMHPGLLQHPTGAHAAAHHPHQQHGGAPPASSPPAAAPPHPSLFAHASIDPMAQFVSPPISAPLSNAEKWHHPHFQLHTGSHDTELDIQRRLNGPDAGFTELFVFCGFLDESLGPKALCAYLRMRELLKARKRKEAEPETKKVSRMIANLVKPATKIGRGLGGGGPVADGPPGKRGSLKQSKSLDTGSVRRSSAVSSRDGSVDSSPPDSARGGPRRASAGASGASTPRVGGSVSGRSGAAGRSPSQSSAGGRTTPRGADKHKKHLHRKDRKAGGTMRTITVGEKSVGKDNIFNTHIIQKMMGSQPENDPALVNPESARVEKRSDLKLGQSMFSPLVSLLRALDTVLEAFPGPQKKPYYDFVASSIRKMSSSFRTARRGYVSSADPTGVLNFRAGTVVAAGEREIKMLAAGPDAAAAAAEEALGIATAKEREGRVFPSRIVPAEMVVNWLVVQYQVGFVVRLGQSELAKSGRLRMAPRRKNDSSPIRGPRISFILAGIGSRYPASWEARCLGDGHTVPG